MNRSIPAIVFLSEAFGSCRAVVVVASVTADVVAVKVVIVVSAVAGVAAVP